jgi:hypothetical protein
MARAAVAAGPEGGVKESILGPRLAPVRYRAAPASINLLKRLIQQASQKPLR